MTPNLEIFGPLDRLIVGEGVINNQSSLRREKFKPVRGLKLVRGKLINNQSSLRSEKLKNDFVSKKTIKPSNNSKGANVI